jgi:pilus assembly protein CpaF
MTYQERQALIAKALLRYPGLENLSDAKLLAALAEFVAAEYEGSSLSLEEKRLLSRDLFHTMRGLDILEELLADPSISEIMVNGPKQIFIEKEGRIEKSDLQFDDSDHLMRMINRCFGRANRNISEQKPLGTLRFPDGSRLQAVLPPASPDGPALSLRRFKNFKPSLSELIRRESLTPQAAAYLKNAVIQKENIFISGGTGSGKTSFLNALSAEIPRKSRVITIEDTAELDLQNVDNLLRLEAREAGPDGKGELSLETLIRTALRLRPDRIIVGEVRGEEAYAMIEAMRSGHPGSMSSGHANNPEDMLDRLALLLLLRLDLPWEAVLRMLYSSLDLIVHLERLSSGLRRVHSIVRPQLDLQGQGYLETVFQRSPDGQLIYTAKGKNLERSLYHV